MPDSQLSPEIPEPHFEEAEAAFQESLGSDFGTASIIEESNAKTVASEMPKRPPYLVFTPTKHISARDHKTAGALAALLGVFGMHKFYLGYHNQGFLLLLATIVVGSLTFGVGILVVWLIVLIEGIGYLSTSQPEFERLYVEGTRPWF